MWDLQDTLEIYYLNQSGAILPDKVNSCSIKRLCWYEIRLTKMIKIKSV